MVLSAWSNEFVSDDMSKICPNFPLQLPVSWLRFGAWLSARVFGLGGNIFGKKMMRIATLAVAGIMPVQLVRCADGSYEVWHPAGSALYFLRSGLLSGILRLKYYE